MPCRKTTLQLSTPYTDRAWNRLPETIRQAQTQSHFKKLLKTCFFAEFLPHDATHSAVMRLHVVCPSVCNDQVP